MDMHHIRYFLAVADTLNFTRAAERCHVTQPALSRAIQQLEEEIGGLLFRREGKLTHITDLGRLLKPRFEQIMVDANAARSTAARFLTMDKASLTLGVMCTIGPRLFAALLADFRAGNAGVELQVIEGTSSTLVERLGSGEIDVALLASPSELPERFDIEPIYPERFTVAFPTGHRFAALNAVPVSALDGESYLRRINCEYRSHLAEVCVEQHCKLNVVHASEREDWILNMVAAGLGICFLPEFSAIVPGVLTRPVIDPEVSREIVMVNVAGRRYSPALLTFMRAIREYPWPSKGAS